MPYQQLALEPGAEQRLRLEWGGYMREFVITLDGQEIGRIDGGQTELKEGRDFDLPDGSTLSVKLHQANLLDELQVMRDGVPLPGSAADPVQKFSRTIQMTFLWGAVIAFFGLLHVFMPDNEVVTKMGATVVSLGAGVAIMGLAYAYYQRNRWALPLALAIYIAEWVVGMYLSSQAGFQPYTIVILARIIFIAPLVQGFQALRDLERLDVSID